MGILILPEFTKLRLSSIDDIINNIDFEIPFIDPETNKCIEITKESPYFEELYDIFNNPSNKDITRKFPIECEVCDPEDPNDHTSGCGISYIPITPKYSELINRLIEFGREGNFANTITDYAV